MVWVGVSVLCRCLRCGCREQEGGSVTSVRGDGSLADML